MTETDAGNARQAATTLRRGHADACTRFMAGAPHKAGGARVDCWRRHHAGPYPGGAMPFVRRITRQCGACWDHAGPVPRAWPCQRSEEHTSELQSLMSTSYAVFCLKKKNQT